MTLTTPPAVRPNSGWRRWLRPGILYGFERDVNRGALAPHLFPKKTVVVITAVEADVVEDSALAIDVNFIAVGTLANADAGSQGEQIFKLAAKDGVRATAVSSSVAEFSVLVVSMTGTSKRRFAARPKKFSWSPGW